MEAEIGRKMYRGSKTGYRGEDEIKRHILLQQRNENEDEFIKWNLRKTYMVFFFQTHTMDDGVGESGGQILKIRVKYDRS
jgi:hypothetical protein